MSSFDAIRKSGVIKTKKGNGFFDVEIDDQIVLCRLCGKMRSRNINVIEGDMVDVEVSISDQTKGRIIYRKKGE